jgi:hypothetical protein
VLLAQPKQERAEESVYRGQDTLRRPVPGRLDIFIPFGDSTDKEGKRIDPILRFADAFRRDSAAWRAFVDSIGNSPEAIMHRNLALDPKDWAPTAADAARRQEDLDRALDWGYLGLTKITHIPLVSVPLSSIGRILGLTEDVTPHISYTVPNTLPVTVKIYNLSAQLVASVVDGVQRPGVYSFDWDLRDASGKRVGSGDYVAEVIVGTRLALRKRIEVP